ncbi:MAG: hypothetical protein RMJ53_07880, partial [Chitinophagales bacterium]|nr:hypothetical protein [Chitinophagales bacterium]
TPVLRHRHTAGACLKGGFKFFSSGVNGVTGDFYIGLGYRYNNIKETIPGEDSRIIEPEFIILGENPTGRYHQLDIIIGVSIGMYFKRKSEIKSLHKLPLDSNP